MTDTATINVGPIPGWQLLAEFSVTSSEGGDRQLPDQLSEAMGEMGLSDQQQQPIKTAVVEAVQRVARGGQPAGPIAWVHIRLWVADKCTFGRGWGFFLVEKLSSDPVGATVKTDSLVDLYLYQEPDS